MKQVRTGATLCVVLGIIFSAISFERYPGIVAAQVDGNACNLGRVMPLGDSITAGIYTGDTPANNVRVGYRKPLYDGLRSIGATFDFVGTQVSGQDVLADPQHEGYPGFTPSQLSTQITSANLLNQGRPDVILLHIGTNGNQLPEPPGNSISVQVSKVNEILNKIDQYNLNTRVILARIINRGSGSTAEERQKTTDFNNALQAMAQNRISGGDKITMVDMEPALNYSTDMSDKLHPNAQGYSKMAAVWQQALCGTTAPLDESVYLPLVIK
jgi:lysophospholipase L1-like esterase